MAAAVFQGYFRCCPEAAAALKGLKEGFYGSGSQGMLINVFRLNITNFPMCTLLGDITHVAARGHYPCTLLGDITHVAPQVRAHFSLAHCSGL